mgnify:FL=1
MTPVASFVSGWALSIQESFESDSLPIKAMDDDLKDEHDKRYAKT